MRKLKEWFKEAIECYGELMANSYYIKGRL